MLDARYDHDHEWEYCKLEVILIASKTEHCLICLMMEWEYCEPKANLMTCRIELDATELDASIGRGHCNPTLVFWVNTSV